MDRALIDYWLREHDPEKLTRLWELADRARRDQVGDEVHLRGLIEFSNECQRNCAYCGIRAANKRLRRYRMSQEEILEAVNRAHQLGYGTVVLQSGEDENISGEWMAGIIRQIKEKFPLAVTLSLGERPIEDYRLWREAGADRYLLKFETSDPELFRKIHPPRKKNEPDRVTLLHALRGQGYEIGSGIMVGIPGQTYDSMTRDLELFAKLDLDMIGIGPFVPHPNTPLGKELLEQKTAPANQVPNTDLMTYKALAITRIICPEANLPATAALATVDPCGFSGGLKAGANVIMPNLTPVKYRALYQIYPTSLFLGPEDLNAEVVRAIKNLGRWPGHGPGDRLRAGS